MNIYIYMNNDHCSAKILQHVRLMLSLCAGCTDVDDALSVRFVGEGNIELGVHIADVSHFVHEVCPATLMHSGMFILHSAMHLLFS